MVPEDDGRFFEMGGGAASVWPAHGVAPLMVASQILFDDDSLPNIYGSLRSSLRHN